MQGLRQKIAFGHDLVMAAISLPLSLYLRLGNDLAAYSPVYLVTVSAMFTVIAGFAFWFMRLYGGVWRYASLNDLTAILKAVTLAVLVYVPVMFLLNRLQWMPRSTLVIAWFVLVALLGGPRFLYRRFKDRYFAHQAEISGPRRVPVLLVGAGDAADLFIRGIKRSATATYEVVGIVDEKGGRVGRNIHGVHVLGTVDRIPEIMDRLDHESRRPRRIILTKDDLDGPTMRELVRLSDVTGVSLSGLPRLTDFRTGVEQGLQIRPIDIEDVLGRAQHVLDRASMQALIKGRRVLVTGAGGTIGGELARQIASFEPAHLALVDSSEYALYAIDLELREQHPGVGRTAILADVRNPARMTSIFADETPELVFHAAALKHVPIVEAFPQEGVLTNVQGTRVVADCCRAAGVRAMVLVSTDKAVNPTSIMGATKRIAETYCQALDIAGHGDAAEGATRYITVRFGNVLGSTGSVVPLFQRQLAAGGPLTVTDPRMTRYFMTVREAVELILEASVLGTRDSRAPGRIYVLDMGEPVKIVDLARQMILLAGLRPDIDIGIEYTGPRPGEKLFEEVLHDSEPPQPTVYPGILLAAPRTAELGDLRRVIDDLVQAASRGAVDEIISLIRRDVPEFQPEAGGPIRVVAS